MRIVATEPTPSLWTREYTLYRLEVRAIEGRDREKKTGVLTWPEEIVCD